MKRLRLIALGVVLGMVLTATGVDLAAQLMQLTDGTTASKVVLYDLAGSPSGSDMATDLDTIATNTQFAGVGLYTDDADFADGSSGHMLNGCVAESASPTTVTEGDVGACAMTLNRALKVALYDASGNALTSGDITFGTTTFTEATSTGPGIGAVRNDTLDSLVNTTNEWAPLAVDAIGALWTRRIDPCSGIAKTYYVVDIATSGTVEIANAVASQYFYICSVNLVTNATNAVVIAEDDTDGCGSISAGVTGGTTAAEGWTFAANGGLAQGNGDSAIAKTTTANRYLCILTSASTQLSGTISYVSAP